MIIGLGVGACRATQDISLVVLVFVADVVERVARLEFTQRIGLETPSRHQLSIGSLGALTDNGIRRDVVGNHVGRLQGVEIQNTDGLIEVHVDLGLNHDGTLLRPILHIEFTPRLGAQDLIALTRNRRNCREDLDALPPEKDPAHGHLADLCHTARVHNRIQLCHEGQHQIAVLNTLPSNPCTLCRTLAMQRKQFLCTDIVLRKRPLQILGSRSEHILF